MMNSHSLHTISICKQNLQYTHAIVLDNVQSQIVKTGHPPQRLLLTMTQLNLAEAGTLTWKLLFVTELQANQHRYCLTTHLLYIVSLQQNNRVNHQHFIPPNSRQSTSTVSSLVYSKKDQTHLRHTHLSLPTISNFKPSIWVLMCHNATLQLHFYRPCLRQVGRPCIQQQTRSWGPRVALQGFSWR